MNTATENPRGTMLICAMVSNGHASFPAAPARGVYLPLDGAKLADSTH
jgi:hypothetical protein